MDNFGDITKSVESIMRQLFSIPDLQVSPSMTAQDIPEWDSLNHIQFIVKVEQQFGIRFKNSEIGQLENIGDLVAAIREKQI